MDTPRASDDLAETLTLDAAQQVTVRLALSRASGRPLVSIAFHDPSRGENDDEVYALLLDPDRAWELSAALSRLAQQAWRTR